MIDPSDTITSEEELRTIYAQPAKPVREKAFPHLDKHSRRYLELSPFFCIGSNQPDGLGDVSPRGGEPGFVQTLDDMHIAFPDRPGNNRLDTLVNILRQPAGAWWVINGERDPANLRRLKVRPRRASCSHPWSTESDYRPRSDRLPPFRRWSPLGCRRC